MMAVVSGGASLCSVYVAPHAPAAITIARVGVLAV